MMWTFVVVYWPLSIETVFDSIVICRPVDLEFVVLKMFQRHSTLTTTLTMMTMPKMMMEMMLTTRKSLRLEAGQWSSRFLDRQSKKKMQ